MDSLKMVEILDRADMCRNTYAMMLIANEKLFSCGYNKTQILEKMNELNEIAKLLNDELNIIETELQNYRR